MLTENDKAPAWSGEDQNGTNVDSTSLLGKRYLLYFYPKDDTPGCTAEACGFRDAFLSLSPKVTIFGVSADTTASHATFISKYALPFTLLADTTKKIIGAFGANGTDFPKRVTFLIGARGTIEKIYSGFDCAKHASVLEKDLAILEAESV